ncbi:Ff.00g031290.m01.CDS01 [Fusarium sp. VM40]|nr:Ff.00g031290.m01.CDS01 [Fusarium sp. VM40]
MATPSPAPSRAAIHALRGVLLTTSCSVIILAEERRRRLNIARAALENAKKLHTARVNRNSAALAESYSSRREAFPVEIAHDFSHAPTNNPLRRRRQRIDSLENGLSRPREIEALEVFETKLPEDTDPTSTPQARQRRWDEWDAARKELSRIYESSSFAHNGLPLRLSPEIALPTIPSPSQRSKTPARGTRTGIESSISKTTLQSKPSEGIDGRAEAAVSEPVNETLIKQLASWSHLDRILAEMESPDMPLALRVEQERKAAKVLQALTSAEVEEPQEILSRGIRLLQSTAVSREYDAVSLILEAVRPVCTDVCLLAVPFLDSLLQRHDAEGVRHLLRRLSGFVPRPVEGTMVENRNDWITRLLMHHWRKTKNFDEVKGVYGMLQEGGLFSDGIFSLSTQYAVRRRIALIALDAGDDATANAEMSQLSAIRPKPVGVDVKLRGRFIVREAELGHWDKVMSELKTFGPKAKQSPQFQNVLSWLTKIYRKNHTPVEIDIFVRELVNNHHMALNRPLAFFVLDRHGRTRNIQALVAWVQFCQDGGMEMDQIFFNEIADKCCKYWSLLRIDVVRMLKDAHGSMPWLQDPLLASYTSNGALHDLHKRLPGENTDTYGIAPALPERRGDSISIYERAAFKHMNTLALRSDWSGVYSAYQEATKKGLGDSSRCLRLAVVANIHIEGAHSCTVSGLINDAHRRKHDISGALVPMLVARLEAGDNAGDLLQENLAKGQSIHDSVYNKAVRVLTQKGNPEAAIRVCEMAAQQNGMGELAYNQFNFASLVHSYTGQGRYRDLASLIESFTSKLEWWQGSKECKESIKLAMKLVASRATRDRKNENSHKEVLLCLDDALQHVKSLRATNKQERETLAKEVVGAFKNADEPIAFEGGFLPDAQVGRQIPKERRNTDWESSTRRDSTPQVLSETRHRIVEDDLPARNQNIDDIRTGQQRTKRERTPSPETSDDEIFLEKQMA